MTRVEPVAAPRRYLQRRISWRCDSFRAARMERHEHCL